MENQEKESKPIRRCPRWTEEEISILKKYHNEYCVKELVEKFKLNHTICATYRELYVLGLASRKHTVWTKKETQELLKLVEQYPHNLSEAYRIHAVNYGRTPIGVECKFQKLRRKNIKTCMVTIGKNKYILNRKNVYDGIKINPIKVKVSKWKRILNILFE